MASSKTKIRLPNREVFSVVRDTLLDGTAVDVSVCGQSMLPFFRSGATIHIRPIRQEDIRKYNVVFADSGRNFVVHRIIDIAPSHVTLLGDGNIIGTERVAHDKIYGIVDCSALHLALARVWVWMRPVRRWPLAILRRISPK